MKRVKFLIDAVFDSALDTISTRLCFGCKLNYAERNNMYFCGSCYKNLQIDYSESIKYLCFNYEELNEFFKTSITNYPKIFFATEYNALTKSLMRSFKYRKPHFAKFWADLILKYWVENSSLFLSELDPSQTHTMTELDSFEYDLYFASVPMHLSKIKQRIYNPTKVLVDELYVSFAEYLKFDSSFSIMQTKYGLKLAELKSVKVLPELFIRKKNTESLFDKKRLERVEILNDAFDLQMPKLEAGPKVLCIIDDITTTGASFLELDRLIKQKTKFYKEWDEIIYLAATGANFAKDNW